MTENDNKGTTVHTKPEKFENATITAHFGFVFEELVRRAPFSDRFSVNGRRNGECRTLRQFQFSPR